MSTAATIATPQDMVLRDNLAPATKAGLIGLAALVLIFGLWAGLTVITGAVIATGQAVVRGDAKAVQHLDGGIVASIAVQNGDLVAAGDPLVTLDPTLLQMNVDVAKRRLADGLALKARLLAEQQGLDAPVFTYPDLPFPMPDMTSYEAGQRQIFAARAAVQAGSRDQLSEALLQYENQIKGITAQVNAMREQIALVDTDLVNMQALTDRNLARQSQLSDLQRTKADLTGRLAGLEAEIARLSNASRDSEIQTLQSERAFHEAVVTELRETTSTTEELILDIMTRRAQLDRIDMRAPVAGIVHEMQVSTVGGVIRSGDVVLQIIPQDQGLDFEMRVDPKDIDQVYLGQDAEAIIASFDVNNGPKLAGTVAKISPQAITDPQTGMNYYSVDLTIPPSEIALLGDVQIVPGMPVEAYLATGDRSVLSYLLSPVTNQMRRAFRE